MRGGTHQNLPSFKRKGIPKTEIGGKLREINNCSYNYWNMGFDAKSFFKSSRKKEFWDKQHTTRG